ncbi:MAG: metallophosphoesterase, partial [Candidatus Zixiibacteriota bacterium]
MPDRRTGTFKTIAVLFVLLLGGANGHFAETGFSNDVEKRNKYDSINDGPYIYWKAMGHAVVFYVCGGELLTAEFQVSDTIRFDGLCHDSATSYKIPVKAPSVENEYFENVSKIFAVSDIHGEYDYLVDILKKGGIIGDGNRWIFGDGHLLIAGDVFDRGEKVTECLWLIYRLEQEAVKSGGRVHYLLGNHELMDLRGDLRYVPEKYNAGIVDRGRISYDRLFGERTEFGRWLRTKNAIVIINGILFVHGGISPELIRHHKNITDINRTVR